MAKKSTSVALPVPAPAARVIPAALPVGESGDARALFTDLTKKTPRDPEAESAFLAAKRHTAQTHPTLDLAARAAAAGAFKVAKAKKPTGPVPGGVGYGMFYPDSFKKNWATGTAIYWEIICPTPPGGNVNNYLYLTATNRSGKGVEAFISYYGQDQTFFKVFDWARYPSAPWQTNIPFANLADYVRSQSAHGHPYQVLPLMNLTYRSAADHWYNQVWLWNHTANRWDLIYQYDYAATLAEQQDVWVGSWGPLGSADSYVRTDNVGFHVLFLDPNFSWAVNS